VGSQPTKYKLIKVKVASCFYISLVEMYQPASLSGLITSWFNWDTFKLANYGGILAIPLPILIMTYFKLICELMFGNPKKCAL
jgi:hypothetical protein